MTNDLYNNLLSLFQRNLAEEIDISDSDGSTKRSRDQLSESAVRGLCKAAGGTSDSTRKSRAPREYTICFKQSAECILRRRAQTGGLLGKMSRYFHWLPFWSANRPKAVCLFIDLTCPFDKRTGSIRVLLRQRVSHQTCYNFKGFIFGGTNCTWRNAARRPQTLVSYRKFPGHRSSNWRPTSGSPRSGVNENARVMQMLHFRNGLTWTPWWLFFPYVK